MMLLIFILVELLLLPTLSASLARIPAKQTDSIKSHPIFWASHSPHFPIGNCQVALWHVSRWQFLVEFFNSQSLKLFFMSIGHRWHLPLNKQIAFYFFFFRHVRIPKDAKLCANSFEVIKIAIELLPSDFP